MKTLLKTTRVSKTDVDHEVSTVLFSVVSASAVLIGLWGAACLIGGLLSHGFVSLLRGYVTAVTGW